MGLGDIIISAETKRYEKNRRILIRTFDRKIARARKHRNWKRADRLERRKEKRVKALDAEHKREHRYNIDQKRKNEKALQVIKQGLFKSKEGLEWVADNKDTLNTVIDVSLVAVEVLGVLAIETGTLGLGTASIPALIGGIEASRVGLHNAVNAAATAGSALEAADDLVDALKKEKHEDKIKEAGKAIEEYGNKTNDEDFKDFGNELQTYGVEAAKIIQRMEEITIQIKNSNDEEEIKSLFKEQKDLSDKLLKLKNDLEANKPKKKIKTKTKKSKKSNKPEAHLLFKTGTSGRPGKG